MTYVYFFIKCVVKWSEILWDLKLATYGPNFVRFYLTVWDIACMPLIMIIYKSNKIQLRQDPNFQSKRTSNELQMFNIILAIFTSIYWFKHCNVSRSTSIHKFKVFCILLTHPSVNYFFALNDYLWSHYKCLSSFMLEKNRMYVISYWRFSFCTIWS